VDSVVRINKAVELLDQRQPIYFEFVEGAEAKGYDGGRAMAQTWADYIGYDIEHSPLDIPGLMAFMLGLVDGGPTRSGHRTPAVIVTLPMDGTSEHAVRANSWMIKQVLATGVHGLLLCHA
jgi:4-hydroxy-2-oxoheptanedioate aldolase